MFISPPNRSICLIGLALWSQQGTLYVFYLVNRVTRLVTPTGVTKDLTQIPGDLPLKVVAFTPGSPTAHEKSNSFMSEVDVAAGAGAGIEGFWTGLEAVLGAGAAAGAA